MVALGTLLFLRLHVFPAALTYATTASDLVLLTTTLMVADGPRSPLLVAYFLVIAASTLRFRLSLVWFATLGPDRAKCRARVHPDSKEIPSAHWNPA